MKTHCLLAVKQFNGQGAPAIELARVYFGPAVLQ